MITILITVYIISTIICVGTAIYGNIVKNWHSDFSLKADLLYSICPIVNTAGAIGSIFVFLKNIYTMVIK